MMGFAKGECQAEEGARFRSALESALAAALAARGG